MFHSRAPRFQVQFTAVYDDGDRYLTAPVTNLSDSGLFIETTAPARNGERVRIIPLLPPSRGLPELEAEVVRVQAESGELGRTSPAGMGVRFVGLSEQDAKLLRAFCEGLRHGPPPAAPVAGGEPLPAPAPAVTLLREPEPFGLRGKAARPASGKPAGKGGRTEKADDEKTEAPAASSTGERVNARAGYRGLSLPSREPRATPAHVDAGPARVEAPPAASEAKKAPAAKGAAKKVDGKKVDAKKVDAEKVDAKKVDAPKVDAKKVDAPKVEAPEVEAPKVEAPKVEAKAEPRPVDVASPDSATAKGATKDAAKAPARPAEVAFEPAPPTTTTTAAPAEDDLPLLASEEAQLLDTAPSASPPASPPAPHAERSLAEALEDDGESLPRAHTGAPRSLAAALEEQVGAAAEPIPLEKKLVKKQAGSPPAPAAAVEDPTAVEPLEQDEPTEAALAAPSTSDEALAAGAASSEEGEDDEDTVPTPRPHTVAHREDPADVALAAAAAALQAMKRGSEPVVDAAGLSSIPHEVTEPVLRLPSRTGSAPSWEGAAVAAEPHPVVDDEPAWSPPARNGGVLVLLFLNLLALGGAVAWGTWRLDEQDRRATAAEDRLSTLAQDASSLGTRTRDLGQGLDAARADLKSIAAALPAEPELTAQLRGEPAGAPGRYAVEAQMGLVHTGTAPVDVVYVTQRVWLGELAGLPAAPGAARTFNPPDSKGAVGYKLLSETTWLGDENALKRFGHLDKKERAALVAASSVGGPAERLEPGARSERTDRWIVDAPAGGLAVVTLDVGFASSLDDSPGRRVEVTRTVGLPAPPAGR